MTKIKESQRIEEWDIVPELQHKYQNLGELATALIVLEEMLAGSLSQVRRVIKEISKDW